MKKIGNAQIDPSVWNAFDGFDLEEKDNEGVSLEDRIKQFVDDLMTFDAADGLEAYVFPQVVWDSKEQPSQNPLAMRLSLYEGVQYEFDLNEAVKQYCEKDGGFGFGLARLSNSLKILASEIDDHIKSEKDRGNHEEE